MKFDRNSTTEKSVCIYQRFQNAMVRAAGSATVRLGQDWLRGVLAARIVRMSEEHSMLCRVASQARICHLHVRLKAV
jgi:hypothetical protein